MNGKSEMYKVVCMVWQALNSLVIWVVHPDIKNNSKIINHLKTVMILKIFCLYLIENSVLYKSARMLYREIMFV